MQQIKGLPIKLASHMQNFLYRLPLTYHHHFVFETFQSIQFMILKACQQSQQCLYRKPSDGINIDKCGYQTWNVFMSSGSSYFLGFLRLQ